MLNNIFNLFSKTQKEETQKDNQDLYNTNDLFNILVSLNEKFEIDIVVYMKDTKHNSLTEIEHAMVCSEFLNSSFTSHIKNQIIEIINKQIKNENNSSLIENISLVDQITDKTKDINNDDIFIQPSQVFSKYIT